MEEEIVLSLRLDGDDADQRLDDLTNSINEQTAAIKEQQKEVRKKTEAEGASSKEVAKLTVEVEKQKNKLKESKVEQQALITVLNTEKNSIKALQAENKKLIQDRNSISTATEEGRKKIAAINDQIDKNNVVIKENSSALEKQRNNVGRYKDSIVEALKEQEFFGLSLNKISGFLTTGAGLFAGAAAALAGITSAYRSSARGAQDFARASDRVNSIIKGFGNAMADSIGSNLVDGVLAELQTIWFGATARIKSDMEVIGREQLRNQEESNMANERFKKEQLDVAERLRQIRDEERNSIEERKQANDDLLHVIENRRDVTIDALNKEKAIYEGLLELDKENVEIKKEIARLEFEIADAAEEAQGFISEQKANDLALSREINQDKLALEQSRLQEQLIGEKEYTDQRIANERRLIEITKQLQLEAAGENEARRQLAIQTAINSERQLLDAIRQERNDHFEQVQEIDVWPRLRESAAIASEDIIANTRRIADENKKAAEHQRSIANYNEETAAIVTGSIGQGISAIGQVASQAASMSEEGSAKWKAFSVTSIIASTAQAVMAALTPPPIGLGPAFGIPLSIAMGIMGLDQINSVLNASPQPAQAPAIAAAGGADFVTSGPQVLIVGDNPGGRERVKVEPLSGRGVTRRFSGGIAMAGGGTLEARGVAMTGNRDSVMTRVILNELKKQRTVLVLQDFEDVQNSRDYVRNTVDTVA